MSAGTKLNMDLEVKESCSGTDLNEKNEDKIRTIINLFRFWAKVRRLVSEDDQSSATRKYVVSLVEEMVIEEILNKTLLLCMECQTDLLELSRLLLISEINEEVGKYVIEEKNVDKLSDIRRKAAHVYEILFSLDVKYSKILKFPPFHDLLEKVRQKHYTSLHLIVEDSLSILDMTKSMLEILEEGYLVDKTIGIILCQGVFHDLKPIVNDMQRKKIEISECNGYVVNILTLLWVGLSDVSSEQVSCILSFLDSPSSSLNTIKTEIEKCEEMKRQQF